MYNKKIIFKSLPVICSLFLSFYLNTSSALELKQGHYFFSGGVGHKNNHSKGFGYGIGMHYRYSEKLEIKALALTHIFEKTFLSYGLENSDTNKYGYSYPMHLRIEQKFSDSQFFAHITDRYFPDFYKGYELHMASLGGSFKKRLLDDSWPFDFSIEFSKMLNHGKNNFAMMNSGLGKEWPCGLTTKVEMTYGYHTEKIEHLYQWLAQGTIGFIY